MNFKEKSKTFNQEKLIILAGILLILLAVIEFIYLGTKKEVWFIDEILSFETANGFEQQWPDEARDEWQDRSDIIRFMAADSGHLQVHDMEVYMTKYADQLPLYYFIFRIVCLIAKGSASIWIGLLINLPIYVAFLFILYKTLLKYTDKNIPAIITVFVVCVYFNRLMLEQATMMRLYMLLLLLEALTVSFAVKLLDNTAKGKEYPVKTLIGMFFITLCGLLSTYDYWAFYAIVAVTFCVYLLILGIVKSKEENVTPFKSRYFKVVYGWIIAFLEALFFTRIIFNYAFTNLLKAQGARALSSFFNITDERFKLILKGYDSVIMDYTAGQVSTGAGLLIIAVILTLGLFILYKRPDKSRAVYLSLTLFSIQAYQIVITYSMPDGYEERYFWGSTTILMFITALCFIIIVEKAFEIIRNVFLKKAFRIAVCIILAFFIARFELTVLNNGEGIAYLNDGGKDLEFLKENSDTPWIVYGGTGGGYGYYDWTIPNKICFLSTDKNKNAVNAVRAISDTDTIVVYCHEDEVDEAKEFFEECLDKSTEYRYVTRGGWLKVYEFTVK